MNETKSNKTLGMISVGHALTHWYPATFYLILPLIGNELGLSYLEIGFLLTFKSGIATLINIPGGIISDLISRKGLLMAIALFWVGMPYLMMSFSTTYWFVLFCISLVGIGNMLWHPSAIPALAHIYPQRKGLALSIHGMGANAGDALAPLFVGVLLTWLTWREAIMINVVPGLIVATIIIIALYGLNIESSTKTEHAHETLKTKLSKKLKEYSKGSKELWKNTNILLLSTSSAFRAMAYSGLRIFIPLYLANELGFSMLVVGIALSAMQVMGFIAAPLAGYYSDKLGRKKIIVFSMVMIILTLFIMVILGNPIVFIFGVAVLGFFLYAMRPVLQAWQLENTPTGMEGTSISIMFTLQSLGASIFPIIGGVIADAFGLLVVFYAIIFVMILANVFVFFMKESVVQNDSSN